MARKGLVQLCRPCLVEPHWVPPLVHKKLSREVRLTWDKEVPPSTLRGQPTPDDGAANDAKDKAKGPRRTRVSQGGELSGYRFSLRSLVECFHKTQLTPRSDWLRASYSKGQISRQRTDKGQENQSRNVVAKSAVAK